MTITDDSPRRVSGSLFLVSVLTLFLEMALIRFVSTEIRIFAYVNNLMLLACFLGLGIGCAVSHRPAALALTPVAVAALIGGMIAPLTVPLHGTPRHLILDTPMLLSALPDFLIWSQQEHAHALELAVGLASTAVIFGTALLAFIPLGQLTGRLLSASPNRLAGYSLNLLASLAGIWVFNGLCAFWAPPWVWFLAVGALAWPLLRRARFGLLGLGLLAAAVAGLAWSSRAADRTTVWSPYQKLDVRPVQAGLNRAYAVTVNNVGYMNLLDLSRRGLQGLPIWVDPAQGAFSQYDVPYRFLGRPAGSVLIVGAGGGNDAAGALRAGAERVTAVEIDPGIYRIGRRLHPEAPYADPRVSVIISDARSVLKRTPARFDVICFGLLDAHSQSSSYNNMRLDHYVYTEESFREAAARLNDDGVMTVIFDAQRPYIAARLGGLLQRVFGQEPLALSLHSDGWFGPGGTMFVIGPRMEAIRRAVQRDPALAQFIELHRAAWQQPVRLTTDDWPYLYLERPRIPALHLWLSGVLLLLLAAVWRGIGAEVRAVDWHFFFLGAAFLLLEFQNISKMSLFFGSTWFVNAVTISAILLLILCANLVASRVRLPLSWCYAGLFASLGALALLPPALWNAFGEPARTILAVGALNAPLFFAGLIFIASFQAAGNPSLAFGSNLLGAAVGGLLETLSFLTGLHALLLIVAALYALSYLVRQQPRALPEAG